MIHPIGFSIHESLIVKEIPHKKKLLAHIIPGKLDTYIFTTSDAYNKDYQESYFAITCKKGGWDCFRHYEILANGCIPLFTDIEKIPENIMTFFPKKLIQETNQLFLQISNGKIVDYDEICKKYISLLLDHTRTYLTTKSMAQYILTQTGILSIKNVLFLSNETSPDYLRCLTLTGFKDLLGKDCHDFLKVPHIYEDYSDDISMLYGKGINYTKKVDASKYVNILNITENIKSHFYDVVICGSIHRGFPLKELVYEYYKPSEIIILCGEDEHECEWKNTTSHFFLREYK
jgi:hypothetical protein